MEFIRDFFMWAIPSGAISSLITWLFNRSTYNARSAKERQEIYKVMYENLSATTLKLQDDFRELNAKFMLLERSVAKAASCRYYDNRCPVRVELQKHGGKYSSKPIGQSADQRNPNRLPRSGTTQHSEHEDDNGQSEVVVSGNGVLPEGWTGEPAYREK